MPDTLLGTFTSLFFFFFWEMYFYLDINRNFLAIQWLGLGIFSARDLGSVSDWGTKILQAMYCGKKKKV